MKTNVLDNILEGWEVKELFKTSMNFKERIAILLTLFTGINIDCYQF